MKVLSLEEKSLPISSIIPLENESGQFKLEHEKLLHCVLDFDKYISVFNNLMSNGVYEKKFQSQFAPGFFRTLMCSRNMEFLAPSNCWDQNRASIICCLLYTSPSPRD